MYNICIIVVVSWKLLVFIQVVIAIVGLSILESTTQQVDCNYLCVFREYIMLVHELLVHVHVDTHVATCTCYKVGFWLEMY